ncbi:hypothetical protein [Sandaracinus amylolyticus]|uniref:Uncharacterized protein n=1 Tax=Sandaracinus amylolyticus TaxID=927083 RepID=A0A0F6YJF3_9BACT|nr:hypothetical protein [Sandaracinus amylolyticus]AKF06035.1 hypothetical protein DB32_003184 [Sandaracinus amylolyticus]
MAREIRPLPAWIALLVSLCVHVALMVGFWLGGGSLFAGGEGGWLGAGGETLEITIAGWDGSRAEDAEEEREPAPAEPPPETMLTAEDPAPTAPREPARDRRTITPERRTEEVAREGGSGGERATPEEPPIAARDGAEQEQTGRAAGDDRAAAVILGSVGLGGPSSGARSLLEDALRCPDPVAGVWTSHRYSPARRNWGRMTLRIQREGDELRGTITSRIWSGLPSDRRPLPCAPGRYDVTVRMPARGRVNGDRFTFGSSSYEVARMDCPWEDSIYYPDSFSGRVDATREELDATNNDGFVEINAPYTFRRISCE